MMGTGCKACDDTGYKGRMGLFEVLEMDDQLARMVIEEKPSMNFAIMLWKMAMRTLRHDGVKKVTSGMTSVAEVMRVTASDEH